MSRSAISRTSAAEDRRVTILASGGGSAKNEICVVTLGSRPYVTAARSIDAGNFSPTSFTLAVDCPVDGSEPT